MAATVVVSHHANERVRHRSEDAERTFGPVIGGVVKATNVEKDAPDEVPRLIIRQGNKVLTLANSRIQLALSFHDRRMPAAQAFPIVERNVQQLFDAIPAYEPLETLGEVGLIVELAYPSDLAAPELAAELARALYRGPRPGSMVSFEIKLGFDNGHGLFVNLGFGLYEYRIGKLLSSSFPQQIDMRSLDVEEKGLAINIDVNNRPSASMEGYSSINSFQSILRESEALVIGGHTEFFRE